ncbi:hypothetical protein SAMN02949497_0314 [Methylomagnum ishizawai]|uniref:Replication protein n=1 Tax=Methylomagnum ishizawai TaxID=1760988 RepID=A0A1Y6DCE7_9GAMM|nr:hypothetical protein [Methylomagnum ishizawai]SMF97519.1 hypothetical protein SAMN02949497_0089 [Methylomagnum ishizawai]SMF97744.1 hypothetical protein SAMN02949497_0314 [Methylomagnum ishizawai]
MPKSKIANNATSPPVSAFNSPQLSLFQTFLCNSDDERDRLSNTIELWDSIPKYATTQQAMNQARTKEGLLPRLEKTFIYKKREYKVRISPAIIDVEGGGDKAFYPSGNEEIVEDALRKIAAEQQKGFFDKPEFKSGVVFSLSLLRRELKKRGHARSYQEIIRSLNILVGSHIEISLPDGKGFAKTSYLPSLATVSRSDWMKDPDARWVAHFHPLVTQSIDALSYRQYNYHLVMSYTNQLARWLHKILAHNYVNASILVSYTLSLASVRRDSGLLGSKRNNDDLRKLEAALNELKEHRVLLDHVRRDEREARNKIVDIHFDLTPHPDFVREIKAANKRQQSVKNPA